jgi:hypothetical protein
MRQPADLEETLIASLFICNVLNCRYEGTYEVSADIEAGSFDLDWNDELYDGGCYTVDSDGDIRICSAGIIPDGDDVVGNVNDMNQEFTHNAYDKLDKR